jgi:hypothetical protein
MQRIWLKDLSSRLCPFTRCAFKNSFNSKDKSLQEASQKINNPHVMDPEDSLPLLQQPTSCTYTEERESSA